MVAVHSKELLKVLSQISISIYIGSQIEFYVVSHPNSISFGVVNSERIVKIIIGKWCDEWEADTIKKFDVILNLQGAL